jgi:hypothetical protein
MKGLVDVGKEELDGVDFYTFARHREVDPVAKFAPEDLDILASVRADLKGLRLIIFEPLHCFGVRRHKPGEQAHEAKRFEADILLHCPHGVCSM